MKQRVGRMRTAATLAGVVPAAMLAVAGFAAGCGGGGGGAPKPPESALLYVKSFSLPNYSGVFLDEDLVMQLSAPVNEGSINPDSIRFRTGASGGVAPFGVFVRGVFMVDPATGNRVVVDPGQITENLLNRVERRGDLSRIPDGIRLDLGFDQPRTSNGGRRPLFDKSRSSTITFVPEVPTRQALDDTGLLPSSTYTVVVPGYPATNTLENLRGAQLLSPNNRIFTSTFTTVPAGSPQLFLGSESAGVPRIIHSSPFNGDDQVPVTETISIRFSHPLDPRSVTPDKFKVELISVPQPFPQVPVSVFLAQQRLGKVEVTLTPINPLPPDGTIRVTVDSGIEDLLGQALNQSTISFFTGTATIPFSGSVTESFVDQFRNDGSLTTANWNNSKPFVGGVTGELTAAFAPYAGDGSDGAFLASVGGTTTINTGNVSQRVYNYTTFSVPIGARVVAVGNFPLVIHCQGAVDVSGEIALDGADGGHGIEGPPGGTLATGGLGAPGSAGGGAGGNGAFAVIGGGGNFDGVNGQGPGGGKGGHTGENDGNTTGGFWPRTAFNALPQTCSNPPLSFEPCRQREGGGGGGFGTAGANADNAGATLLARDGSSTANGGMGGPAWGSASFVSSATPAHNASTSATVTVVDPVNSGTRTITLTGIPTLVSLHGGSGGGGGGGEDDKDGGGTGNNGTADGSDEGGGGGGAGGGALQIVTYATINIAGKLSVKGGAGGSSFVDLSGASFSQGAGGGGGSGGAIWLQCRGAMTFQLGAVVDLAGGIGGQGRADGSTLVYTAGAGGSGRLRIEDSDGVIPNAPAAASTGVFTPALDLDSVAFSTWQNTGIFTPNFGAPNIDATVFPALPFNGAIRVFLEGAPENVLTVPDDPDTANSTGFIKVYDTALGGLLTGNPWDLLDNNKWWRFKVEFHVDAFHTFTDPMPTVREITVNITR